MIFYYGRWSKLSHQEIQSYMELDLDAGTQHSKGAGSFVLPVTWHDEICPISLWKKHKPRYKSLKPRKGRTVVSQQGRFLVGSHRPSFMEQTESQGYHAVENVLSNILVCTFSPDTRSKRSLIPTFHLFEFCVRSYAKSLPVY